MTLIQDNQARINKLEWLYTKIKARTEKTIVSDVEPESPTLWLQWFDTSELAFKLWGWRDWETTTVKSLSVWTNPNWFRVDEWWNLWSGRETLATAQLETFAVTNAWKLYAKNVEISWSITITSWSSWYSNITDKPDLSVYAQTNNLWNLAFENLVQFAKLWDTLIQWWYIKTDLLNVNQIFAQNITATWTIQAWWQIWNEWKIVLDWSDGSIRSYDDNLKEFFTVSPNDEYFYVWSRNNYLQWDSSWWLTVKWNITITSW